MNDETRQFITDAINAHGIFFKKAVRRQIETFGAIGILDEEHATSFPEQTAIDLLLECPGRGSRLKFVVVAECKKAYAPHKNWIFFRDRTEPIKSAYLVGIGHHVHITMIPGRSGLDAYSDGIEVDTSKLGRKGDVAFGSGSCDAIFKAASQVCRGFLGFVAAQSRQTGVRQDDRGFGPFLCFPLIITNASLFSCENDFAQVSLDTGNLEAPLQLEAQRWVLLRHPFADVTREPFRDFRTDKDQNTTPEERGLVYKEPVFIVDSKHLKEFFVQCPVFQMNPDIA